MTENKKSISSSFIPLAIITILFVIYLIFNLLFAQCYGINCNPINTDLISGVDNTNTLKLSDAANKLTNKIAVLQTESNNLNNRITSQKTKENDIANIKEKIAIEQRNISNIKSANANADTNAQQSNVNTFNANLNAHNAELAVFVVNTNKALQDKNTTAQEVKTVDSQISKRYSSRMIWVFLTMVFSMLCLASIGFSGNVIYKSFSNEELSNLLKDKEYYKFIFQNNGLYYNYLTALISIGIAVFAWRYDFMSVVEPLYANSLEAGGDLARSGINVFNVILIAAIIWLVVACCSILYKVQKITQEITKPVTTSDVSMKTEEITNPATISDVRTKNETPSDVSKKYLDTLKYQKQELTKQLSAAGDAPKSDLVDKINNVNTEKTEVEKRLGRYDIWRKYLQTILYISGGMLFVGLLRINTLSDWHLLFVSPEFSDSLKDFFKYSFSIQAGFYTILLAVIYLPVSYMIPDTPKSPNVEDSINEQGFLATINNFLPNLLAIILPLLADPVANLLKYFFVGQTSGI